MMLAPVNGQELSPAWAHIPVPWATAASPPGPPCRAAALPPSAASPPRTLNAVTSPSLPTTTPSEALWHAATNGQANVSLKFSYIQRTRV